jgi:predicted TIM-barrel fold metal-dependent hydrolase
MGSYDTAWLIDGRVEPHPTGPGAQPANVPRTVLPEFGATPDGEPSIESRDLSEPAARLRDMDRMGVDVQMLFPTTLYACMTSDAGLEAALYRAYNRYMGQQCAFEPRRLKWAGLLPLRATRQSIEALHEMRTLGASAAVVFGTAGDRMLSHLDFTPVWDELGRTGLPLCVHMGRSYPPFDGVTEHFLDAHMISMSLPGQMAFAALIGHGMLDRYLDLKVAFLEFGAEWIFYMVGRGDHYLERDRFLMRPLAAECDRLPRRSVEDYVRSGAIFLGGEMDDRLMVQEIELLGEDQLLFSADFPHGEARENAATELLERSDISAAQKRKIFYDNAVRFFGEP